LCHVIKEAKRCYDEIILKSSNKCTTTLDIIKELSRKQHSETETRANSKHLQDQQDTADAFNNYFSSISDKRSKNNIDNKITFIPPRLSFLKLFQSQKLHL